MHVHGPEKRRVGTRQLLVHIHGAKEKSVSFGLEHLAPLLPFVRYGKFLLHRSKSPIRPEKSQVDRLKTRSLRGQTETDKRRRQHRQDEEFDTTRS